MESINILCDALNKINGLFWGWPMLAMISGIHVYFTLKLRFPQQYLPAAIKQSFGRSCNDRGDLSNFESLSIALAATIGTGNIIGVALAIALGGPGALLWMWFAAVLGIATKYAEALLSFHYRKKTKKGRIIGGPMCVLEYGLHRRWLAMLFCAFAALTALGIGNMVPAHTLASVTQDTFKVDSWVTGACIAIFSAVVIIGGAKSIADVCTKLVPFMAIVYMGGCCCILATNSHYLLPSVKMIIVNAFSLHAAVGGFAGAGVLAALRYGIALGPFTNDSGFGTSPIAAAASRADNSARNALIASSGTFWHMVVFSGIAGLALVSGFCRKPMPVNSSNGLEFIESVFLQIPVFGNAILLITIAAFTFCAVLGWSYYGERVVEHLFHRKAIPIFRYFWILALFFGSLDNGNLMPLIREFSVAASACMVALNLLSLFLLRRVVVDETREYLWKKNDNAPAAQRI